MLVAVVLGFLGLVALLMIIGPPIIIAVSKFYDFIHEKF
jgi:hypothetical protein